MKCRLLYLSLIIFTNQHLVAQEFDFTNNPMQFSYKLPKQIDAIEKNEQMIPYSTIGDYQKTLELADLDEEKAPILTQKDSLHFYNFKAQAALPYLIEQAKASKITIINEAHHNPRHRVFTTQLLKELYKEGYRYFGLEALTSSVDYDQRINTDKFPALASGFYIVEPQFGNLVREAMKIGFTLFSYEHTENEGGKKREIGQASNIKTFMDKHPDGKYLIHCGYDHAIEADIGGDWEKAMAGRLKEYTGINPFTINQVHLTEKSDSMYENPFFKKINESTPSVFLDKNGNVFNGPEGQNYVDVRIYHPRTQYVNGRPNWLIIEGRKWVNLSTKEIKIGFPCLAKAYYSDEPNYAVPTDVMVINDKKEQKAFALKKGNYRVLINNEKGETQTLTLEVK